MPRLSAGRSLFPGFLLRGDLQRTLELADRDVAIVRADEEDAIQIGDLENLADGGRHRAKMEPPIAILHGLVDTQQLRQYRAGQIVDVDEIQQQIEAGM